jgi:iron complex outermembrane receptor protein
MNSSSNNKKQRATAAGHSMACAARLKVSRRISAILLSGPIVAMTGWPLVAADSTGGAGANPTTSDLMSLDLDALTNMKVTSVSKKEEKLSDAATAITVLSNEDIRLSGATSVAESLRMVPGMDVAQVNTGSWAISARGFDEIFSRSLLVLVDGRTVYTPQDGGVAWDLQQQMLEDLDRIEVIRGPGGTLWGANAVNGVINIVSKSARDTQGAFVYGGGGTVHEAMGGARYGGQLDDNTYYRVFGGYQKNDSFDAPGGGSAMTGYQGGQGGFRVDHYNANDAHGTFQGDFTKDDLYNHTASDYNFNTVGRWTRTISDRSSVEFQAYVDRLDKSDRTLFESAVNTLDLSGQHNFGLGERNDVIWGLNYRFIYLDFTPGTDPSLVRDPHYTEQLASVFLQDEFKIVPDKLTLTAGCKVEYNTITGPEFQPNLRLSFKPAENQTLWAAVSRSVIIPTVKAGGNPVWYPAGSVIPGGGPGGADIYPRQIGNPDIHSAILTAFEVGYRIQPVKRVSFDVAAFYNKYTKLGNQVETGQLIPFASGYIDEQIWINAFDAVSYGGETSVTAVPFDGWRLTAAYSLFKMTESGYSPDTDVLGGSPMQQASLRSSYDFWNRATLSGQIRYVDRVAGADAYVTGDVRLAYRPTDKIELSIVGQNLFQDRHVELGAGVTGQVPRGVYGKVAVKF